MTRIAVLYGLATVVFVVVDMVWLMYLAKGFYRDALGDMLAARPNLAAAVPFYLLYVAGIVVFAALPGMRAQDWTTALWLGALLGLFAYGTYDLTNLATLRGWPVSMSIIDMLWGSVVTAAAATGGMLAASWLARAT